MKAIHVNYDWAKTDLTPLQIERVQQKAVVLGRWKPAAFIFIDGHVERVRRNDYGYYFASSCTKIGHLSEKVLGRLIEHCVNSNFAVVCAIREHFSDTDYCNYGNINDQKNYESKSIGVLINSCVGLGSNLIPYPLLYVRLRFTSFVTFSYWIAV